MTYLKASKEFTEVLKSLYESEKATIDIKYSFHDLMYSNETRLFFLNELFDNIQQGNLSEECQKLFSKNIDFIHKFINGKVGEEIEVPQEFIDDMTECRIIPTQEDIKYLFWLIDQNMKVYESIYSQKYFYIHLPNNSFNMNMARIMDIKKKNIAHLLGLTESEPQEDPKKNLLKKYFLKKVDNSKKYGNNYSERLLNWLMSSKGRQELLRINQLTLDFVKKDQKKNPSAYDENGNIKSKSLDGFIKRFKEEYKKEKLDFPIIKFSRYIVKCINNLNFLNMENINQVILDYNAPSDPNDSEKKTKKDEKDMYFVSLSSERLLELTNIYESIKDKIFEYINKYGKFSSNLDKKIEEELKKYNLNDMELLTLLNLIKTYDFVGKHGIKSNEVNYNNAKQKIIDFISKKFKKEIHLIGFGTDFSLDSNKRIITTKLSQVMVNESHCDTSIALNIGELIDDYYKRGRAFFLDKIGDSDGGNLRVSNPVEEERFNLLMHKKSNLGSIRERFNNNYYMYKDSYYKDGPDKEGPSKRK